MTYFAHKTESGKTQTVKEHCTNVAEMAKSFAESVSLSHTAYLAGLYHDVGKCSNAFQSYLDQNEDINATNLTRFKRGDIDHSYAGGKYLYEHCTTGDPVSVITAELLAIVIGSHHGTRDLLKLDGEDVFSKRLLKDSYYVEIEKACEEEFLQENELKKEFSLVCAEIDQTFKTIQSQFKTNRHSYYGMVTRLLLSMVIDADRTDTMLFSQEKSISKPANSKMIWIQIQEKLNDRLTQFPKTNDMAQWRSDISDQCYAFAEHSPGLYQLIVPTGGGKTLASLRYALEHAIRYQKDRIFYIAPFNSILEQNCSVLRDIIQDDALILEHHCNVEDSDEAYELLAQTWDCPLIATTMVQFLNTLFSHKTTAIRRMHRLSNAIIIIDEIQSLPIKCIGLFNLAMNFLTKICGSTVILCSATQPILDQIKIAPIDFSQPKSMLKHVDNDFIKFKRTEIRDMTNPPYSYEEAAKLIEEKGKENNNALVIVNTKKSAKALYDILKKTQIKGCGALCKLKHLSTNMCPAHRKEVLDEIKVSLQKNEPVICIATQLIEAGVDISFRCVIRSLAGLDSIAQAAGRCNRNGDEEIRNVYVLRLKDESLKKLPEIVEAQYATGEVFRMLTKGEDLISPKAINSFYEKYYYTQEDQMSYIIPKEKTTILDVLSHNNKAREAHKLNFDENPQHFFNQGFKTAGESFHVIDDNNTGIIVPFNDEAKEIILELSTYGGTNMLKSAQKYTVAVLPYFLEELKKLDAIYMPGNCGVWVLREEYYEKDIGIDFTPGLMEPDCI